MKNLDITIMGRDFRIACPEQEEASLMMAVDLLDGRIESIKRDGKVVGADRIAIMAALNIAHEMLSMKMSGTDVGMTEFRQRLLHMQEVIDQAMLEQNRLF
ncbi:cell division protein ZapA [Chitinivorax tropicus]|uniref:Cell division protein ZapA n=1 Tax=Chitinivorax tropicus TaxID=714531 RepID=A0A840MIL5_9PROT|nr:cell division protein ZapA [Chitinivorax tropicus]MBB5017039.1 cell division protein ZapA [Chitinivorax tropicus]